tara:strand:+ start:260 stop:1009 length:750 start_codon:yes stop_codon:yes gene_type:complete
MVFKYLENYKFIAFSHRGGAIENNENTLDAFQKSIELGYKYIETDVQNTRDDKLVIFHDDDLKRIANLNIKISEIDYEDLKKIKIFNSNEIPLFIDTINQLEDIFFNIDPKSDRAAILLNNLLIYRNDLDRFCVGSYTSERVNLFRGNYSNNLATSMSKEEVIKFYVNQIFNIFKLEIPCVQVPLYFKGIKVVTRKFVELAHSQNKKVHVWTINDQYEMEHLIKLGVDGIMTDKPTLLKEVLIKNELWY